MITWIPKADMTEGRGKCTKRSVRIARKSAKFLSSPEMTVRFTARNATQSARIAVVKRATGAKNARFLRVRKIGSVKRNQAGSNLFEPVTVEETIMVHQ